MKNSQSGKFSIKTELQAASRLVEMSDSSDTKTLFSVYKNPTRQFTSIPSRSFTLRNVTTS
jgi:hypothetical protein